MLELTTHNMLHVYGVDFDPESCAECAAMLERLTKNAIRWSRQQMETPVH